MGIRVHRWAVLVVLMLATAACTAAPPPQTPQTPAAADVAAVDADYARMMTPHHEQALELSALVGGRSASPEVADLAFRIDREQVEEVGQLQGFLRLRGGPVDGAATGGTGTMGSMAGMAGPAVLERLRTSSGPAFDRLWLETMTAHHEGALAMAREHLAATGGTGALVEFSRTLLVSQQAEIDRMTTLLAA